MSIPSIRITTLLMAAVAFLSACSTENPPEADASGLERLRVGILPDQDSTRLTERLSPLMEYLSGEIGLECELVVPESYAALTELFAAGKVDLAYFGGVTFVRTQQKIGAVPVVFRAADRAFTSYFLVRAESPLRAIDELRGKSIAFGSRLSTSGHLMPRYFLSELGHRPESFFSSVAYSGSHDRTASWVRDGKADVGVANSKVVERMYREGRLSAKDVRVLWETPSYTNYVWAIQPALANRYLAAIRDAFLGLSADREDHAAILRSVDADHFLPASRRDFAQLEQILQVIGDNP